MKQMNKRTTTNKGGGGRKRGVLQFVSSLDVLRLTCYVTSLLHLPCCSLTSSILISNSITHTQTHTDTDTDTRTQTEKHTHTPFGRETMQTLASPKTA